MSLPGYESVGMAMPPMLPKPPPEVVKYTDLSRNAKAVDPEGPILISLSISHKFSFLVAREALLRYIGTTCCWGSGPAKSATIETEVWSAISCSLETFIEYRIPEWVEVPYRQEPITALGQGYAPQPWELQAAPVPHFIPTSQDLEVPFTSTIRICDGCDGRRKIRCTNCGGDGKLKCKDCGGDGKVNVYRDGENHKERCDDCGGDGKVRCRYQGLYLRKDRSLYLPLNSLEFFI
jgi:hypothetical protein